MSDFVLIQETILISFREIIYLIKQIFNYLKKKMEARAKWRAGNTPFAITEGRESAPFLAHAAPPERVNE